MNKYKSEYEKNETNILVFPSDNILVPYEVMDITKKTLG